MEKNMEGYIYDSARLYAHEAEEQAKAQVNDLDIETLRKEYVSLTGLVAYYTKVERVMAQPRMHMEEIKKLLVRIKADQFLSLYEQAEEQGVEIAKYAQVPAMPLVELLSRLKAMTTS